MLLSLLICLQAKADNINVFADCGIGAMVFEDDTAAIISNVTWDFGTTALSSKISSPDSCEGVDKDVAEFIINSYDHLTEDAAKGQGVYLTALLDLSGCSAHQHTAAIETIRSNMPNILNSDISKQVSADALYHVSQLAAQAHCVS